MTADFVLLSEIIVWIRLTILGSDQAQLSRCLSTELMPPQVLEISNIRQPPMSYGGTICWHTGEARNN